MSASPPPAARPRRRRGVRPLLAVALGLGALLLTGRSLGGTFALPFYGEANYPSSSMTLGVLSAPSGLSATPSGNSVNLAWTAGTHGNGETVAGVDTGSATSCTSANTFTTITSALGATATSYTDTNRATAAGVQAGDNYCYDVATAYGTTWSADTYVSARVGFATTGVAITNGATVNSIRTNDYVTLTFNQAPTTPTATGVTRMCAVPSTKTLIIGVNATCSSGATALVGKLVYSGTMTTTNTYTVSYTVTGSTLKILVTTTPGTPTTVGTGGTWTFTPTSSAPSSLVSASGAVAACSSNTNSSALCAPTTTTTF